MNCACLILEARARKKVEMNDIESEKGTNLVNTLENPELGFRFAFPQLSYVEWGRQNFDSWIYG